jgi:hypothetical protein
MDRVSARTKQRHRSAEEWRRLVSAWKQRGVPREMWCRENGVGKESHRRWTKRLLGTDNDMAFVQIEKAVPVAAKSAMMRLRILASGEVELIGKFDDELLRRVLRVAREGVDVS